MKRAILRLPDAVEAEIISWTDGKGPRLPSPQLWRSLMLALGEPVEILGDSDLDVPTTLKVWGKTFIEQRK